MAYGFKGEIEVWEEFNNEPELLVLRFSSSGTARPILRQSQKSRTF